MFLDRIKDFWTKKIVKKGISNVTLTNSEKTIKKIGIVFDESYFYEKDELINHLIQEGIKKEDIQILVFKNKIKKNEVFDYPVFSYRDLSWRATIDTPEFKNFITADFDLLINYYDIEKAALLLTTHSSKAGFKVGFVSIDKRLNHFMIDTNAENYKVFMEELIKYLKILNKI